MPPTSGQARGNVVYCVQKSAALKNLIFETKVERSIKEVDFGVN